jgi:cytochrome c peroxidase
MRLFSGSSFLCTGLVALTLLAAGCASETSAPPAPEATVVAPVEAETPPGQPAMAESEPAAAETAITSTSEAATNSTTANTVEATTTLAARTPETTQEAKVEPAQKEDRATRKEEKPASAKPADEKEPVAKTNGGKVLLGSPELTAGIPGKGPLTLKQIEAWLADDSKHQPLDFELPLGLSAGAGQVKGVDENPLTLAKIELGRQLYFDPRLSADTGISCASCHHPDEGYTRHTRFGVGINKLEGNRNSPISYNRILSDLQFWDGRAASLEEQALGPIANPIEMGSTHDACVECLKGIPGYKLQFEKVFGALTAEAVGQALATFERVIVTGPTPFDYNEQLRPYANVDLESLQDDDPEAYAEYEKYLALAEKHPMSDSAKRGRELFFGQKAGCTACHVGPNLTDEKYHNLGIGADTESPDLGRFVVTEDDKDRGAFKTPTIRNVALSAPYMHDGSLKTLEEVVAWYDKGGHPNPHLSDKIKKLDLTEQEKKDLVEFMKACTGEFPKVETARLPE